MLKIGLIPYAKCFPFKIARIRMLKCQKPNNVQPKSMRVALSSFPCIEQSVSNGGGEAGKKRGSLSSEQRSKINASMPNNPD